MPEETEEVKEKEQPVTVPEPEPPKEPEIPPAEPVSDEDLAKEPGGDSVDAVYARKRVRELRDQLDRERTERIRAEERAKAVEEQAKAQATKTEILSYGELLVALNAGEITAEQFKRYEKEILQPHLKREIIKEQKREQAEQAPLERATKEVGEYIDLMPSLRDRASEKFTRVATKYDDLVGRGYPDDIRTQSVALEIVYGNLDTLKRKAAIDAKTRERGAGAMPSDAGAGGEVSGGNKKLDISKAPADLKSVWDKTNTSQADREWEYRTWQEKQAGKGVRA